MDTLELYRDHAGEYRWRLTAKNGRNLADSGEGYQRKREALKRAGNVVGISEPDDHPIIPGYTYIRADKRVIRVVETLTTPSTTP